MKNISTTITNWKSFGMVVGMMMVIALVVKPYFNSGFPYTHDGENHLARFANYKIALKEGQFPPRWAPNLLNRYGYPVFNFNYPLANMLSLPFSLVKLHYEFTFKLIAISAVVLGAMGIWFWLAQFNLSRSSRWWAVAATVTSPFIVSLITFRGSIGELLAWSLFPWGLWSVGSAVEGSRFGSQTATWRDRLVIFVSLRGLTTILILTAIWLAHNVSALMIFPCLVLYAAIVIRAPRVWYIWLAWSFLLSTWFWLPALLEKSQTVLDEAALSQQWADHFPTFIQLIASPIEFGFSFPGAVDSLSFSMGWIVFVSLIGAGCSFLKNRVVRQQQPWLVWLLLAGWLLVIGQTKIAEPIWSAVPLVHFIQFPWRLTLVLTIVAAPIIAWFFSHLRSKSWLLMILVGLQLITVSRVRPVDYFHRDPVDYDAFSQTTTTTHENMPRDFKYQEIGDWQPTASVLSGQASIMVQRWAGSYRSYQVHADTEVIMVEPTARFAGWRTTSESRLLPYLTTVEELTQGRLAYSLPPGEHQIVTRFTQSTWPRLVGNGLTLTAGVLYLSMVGWKLIWPQINTHTRTSHRNTP